MNSTEFTIYLTAQSEAARRIRAKLEADAFFAFWSENQHLLYGAAREAMAARDAEAAGPFPIEVA